MNLDVETELGDVWKSLKFKDLWKYLDAERKQQGNIRS
jgi:hypothetical protein